MEVPFLSKDTIENSVVNLLNGFGKEYTPINEPPVPVEEICEKFLQLDIVPGDLKKDFPVKEFGDAIGALDYDDKSVYVDNEQNKLEGRFLFTISHEIGHYVLHIPYLLRNQNQENLFEGNGHHTIVVCRKKDENLWQEWQANAFASALLMPKPILVPFILNHKRIYKIENVPDPFNRFPCYLDELVWELKNKFKVSKIAAIIRLKDLKVIEPATARAA